MLTRLLPALMTLVLIAGCGGGAAGDSESSEVPSVPPLPTPASGVEMRLVEVDPVAFLAPKEMTEQDVTSASDPPKAYLESAQQVEALPAGIAVRMLDGGGDLDERGDRHESGLTESDLAEIEDLTREDVPWPGIGEATQLSYVARPIMALGTPLQTVDVLTVVDDATVLVSISAPPELWDRLSLHTVVASLRNAS
ncbi:hypothetical protein G7072_19460 [Nocardioides sp. HDW12B]|uniref:hypothetical protein n=1 Tax=Nocardioides sp. HDW12B TaxID=2714939 RepID=UPI00140D1820|nr:hypothetical protein [Nocardioides sp. HDW12B]QIK68226.1 hypothetical protein G7072_19460 [Nocardioides sp. HDW12B]